MNKKVIWIIGIVLAFLVLVSLYIIVVPLPTPQNPSKKPENTAGNTKKACEVFTDKVAKRILGPKARKSESVSVENQSSTENIVVSNCGYEFKTTIANVLIRGAKRQEAYSTNIFGFNGVRTQGIEGKKTKTIPIKKLGDEAFYHPQAQQVNVLVNQGQYWVIVQINNDKALAERLARAIVEEL